MISFLLSRRMVCLRELVVIATTKCPVPPRYRTIVNVTNTSQTTATITSQNKPHLAKRTPSHLKHHSITTSTNKRNIRVTIISLPTTMDIRPRDLTPPTIQCTRNCLTSMLTWNKEIPIPTLPVWATPLIQTITLRALTTTCQN